MTAPRHHRFSNASSALRCLHRRPCASGFGPHLHIFTIRSPTSPGCPSFEEIICITPLFASLPKTATAESGEHQRVSGAQRRVRSLRFCIQHLVCRHWSLATFDFYNDKRKKRPDGSSMSTSTTTTCYQCTGQWADFGHPSSRLACLFSGLLDFLTFFGSAGQLGRCF